MLNFKTILLCAIFIFSANAYGASDTAYFNADYISPTLLNPPALPGSKQYEKEVNYIITLQENPDLNEVEAAFEERYVKPEMIAQFVIKDLERTQYPHLYRLLDRVYHTSKYATAKAKNYWKLQRPYVAVKAIEPLIAAHKTPAYPSGHSTKSYVMAHVLSLIFADKRSEFLARAEEIAQHRVLTGLHFPQDINAGKDFALLIVGGLLQNEEFQEDLRRAKQEVLQ